MINLGIIASGSGSNAEAIMRSCEIGRLKGKAKVSVLISNKENAYCLERAEKHEIPSILIESEGFHGSREDYDRLLVVELKKYNVDLVALAGYMRLVSSYFIQEFPFTMNIHPSLLPSFPGMYGYRDAIEYGVKITGCSVIFVDDKTDHGPIILQQSLEVNFEDTEDSLRERGLKLEWEAFPTAIELFCDDRLEIIGRKVKIRKEFI